MHLIRSIDGFIEDIENGRTYMYDEGLPDYETGKTEVTLTVRNWYQENHIDLAYNEEALRFWKYLETLLKFDITTTADPQPAPADTPEPKFCVGQTVGIIGTKYFGEVLKTRTKDDGLQYFLKRAYTPGENQFLGWFAENMLDPENNVPDEYANPAD